MHYFLLLVKENLISISLMGYYEFDLLHVMSICGIYVLLKCNLLNAVLFRYQYLQ